MERKIKITLDELKALVDYIENGKNHGNMKSYVFVSTGKHPNGREYIEFEQPCWYAECNSGCMRFGAIE